MYLVCTFVALAALLLAALACTPGPTPVYSRQGALLDNDTGAVYRMDISPVLTVGGRESAAMLTEEKLASPLFTVSVDGNHFSLRCGENVPIRLTRDGRTEDLPQNGMAELLHRDTLSFTLDGALRSLTFHRGRYAEED